jgi:phage terminase small subunit
MAGRPPKSTAEHKRNGTYTPSRHGHRQDEMVSTGASRRPAWVKTPHAKWLWDHVSKALADGVLTSADTPIFAAACRWWDLWRGFDARIGNGEDDEYRMTILAVTAWKQCDGCLTKMGLSPTQRTKLQLLASAEAEPDDDERFFKVRA